MFDIYVDFLVQIVFCGNFGDFGVDCVQLVVGKVMYFDGWFNVGLFVNCMSVGVVNFENIGE